MADCGLVGIFSKKGEDIYEKLVHSLHVLQHRGEDACGILIYNRSKGKFYLKRRLGLVSMNFRLDRKIPGDRGIGHTRYPTTNLSAKDARCDIQPLEIAYPWIRFFIAHNGTIISFCHTLIDNRDNQPKDVQSNLAIDLCHYEDIITPEEARAILYTAKSEMEGGTDTELIGRILAHVSRGIIDREPTMPKSIVIENAFRMIAPYITGSYSFLIQTEDAILGIRDPLGIRPLCFIEPKDAYILASESCVMNELRKLYYHSVKIPRTDVKPGTGISITDGYAREFKIMDCDRTAYCIFEDAYFSRPDSNVRGKILSTFRQKCGERLGQRLKQELSLKDAEDSIIIPIPDGGIPFGVGISKATNIQLMFHGLIRDKYTGRTFIRGSNTYGLDRGALVMRKLSFLHDVIRHKTVILADDSIVRGTTTRRVSKMAIEAGAKDVIWCFNFPPIRYTCPLGIEMFKGGRDQFIANKVESVKTHKDLEVGIAKILGAKLAFYMTLQEYVEELGLKEDQVCTGCITGKYPFDELTKLYGIESEKE